MTAATATPDFKLSSARDKAEDITFAVEIKSIIPKKLSTTDVLGGKVRPFVPHRPKESRESMTDAEKQIQKSTYDSIATALCSIPKVQAITQHHIQASDLERSNYWRTHWMVYKANSAVPLYVSYEDGDDERPVIDVTAPGYDNFVWIPVELSSPAMHWKSRDEAVTVIRSACRILQDTFNAVANHSTEVHVHVGRGDGLFYSLRTMKRLATVMWLSEPILRGLKDPRSLNFDHTYTWSSPLRGYSRIALALQGRLPGGQTIDNFGTGPEDEFEAFVARTNDVRLAGCDGGDRDGDALGAHRQALRAIWRASTHEELGRMLCGIETKYRRLGFNFHALGGEDERAQASPRTVEFRFFEGCADEDAVAGWVQACIALTELATDKTEDREFYDMVVLLLGMPSDWPLDAQFAAVMHELGLATAAYEPLRAIVRINYPPSETAGGL